jgi:hypothetical protein
MCRNRLPVSGEMSSKADTSSPRDGSGTSRAAPEGLGIESPDHGDDSLRDAAGMPPDKRIRRLAYASWSKRYIRDHGLRQPAELDAADAGMIARS